MLVKRDIHMPKNEIEPLSYSITTINTRWIKDLTVRTEMVKLLKENRGKSFLTLVLAMIFFLDVTQKSQATQAKIDKSSIKGFLGGSALKNPAAIQVAQH